MKQLIMKISEIKLRRFEATLTSVSNLNTKKDDTVYVYIRCFVFSYFLLLTNIFILTIYAIFQYL